MPAGILRPTGEARSWVKSTKSLPRLVQGNTMHREKLKKDILTASWGPSSSAGAH